MRSTVAISRPKRIAPACFSMAASIIPRSSLCITALEWASVTPIPQSTFRAGRTPMLFKQGAGYLLARVIPGLVAFSSLAIYTRILSPEDFGRYVLVLAAVNLGHVTLFGWLGMALLRFMPSRLDESGTLLSTTLGMYVLLVLAVVCGMTASLILVPSAWRGFLVAGMIALCAGAWLETNLNLCQSRLLPGRYGSLLMLRSVCALAIGSGLSMNGWGAYGPLTGLIAGALIASIGATRSGWRGVRPQINRPLASELLRYGAPLTGSAALLLIMSSADRFMIARFIDNTAVGAYSASYDLASQSLGLLMVSVNLAAYPLAIRAYERGGRDAALSQLRQHGSFLLLIALPATIGLILLSEPLAIVCLGEEYRSTAALILPWIGGAIFIAGLKAYFFDIAFQLAKRSATMMWSVGTGALVNIALNFWCIPAFGVLGAAWATMAAYVAALAVCVSLGRSLMPITFDWEEVIRIVACCAVMTLAVLAYPPQEGLLGLLLQVFTGVIVYGTAAVAIDALGLRGMLVARVRSWV